MALFSSAIGKESPSWKEQTKYKFSQAWVWQYQNDWISPGEAGHQGEITVYYDSLSRAWLFDPEAFGDTGQGFDFVLAEYSGQFVFCFKNEKGKKRKAVRTVPEIVSSRIDNPLVTEEFETHNKKTGKSKVFGRNIYGWPIFNADEYVLQYLKTEEKSIRYVADSDVDFQSVVYFNFLEGEIKLPFHFPTDIPVGKVLIEDSTTYEDGKKIILRLKEVTDTDYHIDLSKYK